MKTSVAISFLLLFVAAAANGQVAAKESLLTKAFPKTVKVIVGHVYGVYDDTETKKDDEILTFLIRSLNGAEKEMARGLKEEAKKHMADAEELATMRRTRDTLQKLLGEQPKERCRVVWEKGQWKLVR
jgi:hypothetical protein